MKIRANPRLISPDSDSFNSSDSWFPRPAAIPPPPPLSLLAAYRLSCSPRPITTLEEIPVANSHDQTTNSDESSGLGMVGGAAAGAAAARSSGQSELPSARSSAEWPAPEPSKSARAFPSRSRGAPPKASSPPQKQSSRPPLSRKSPPSPPPQRSPPPQKSPPQEPSPLPKASPPQKRKPPRPPRNRPRRARNQPARENRFSPLHRLPSPRLCACVRICRSRLLTRRLEWTTPVHSTARQKRICSRRYRCGAAVLRCTTGRDRKNPKSTSLPRTSAVGTTAQNRLSLALSAEPCPYAAASASRTSTIDKSPRTTRPRTQRANQQADRAGIIHHRFFAPNC